jgi:hypothetical protein
MVTLFTEDPTWVYFLCAAGAILCLAGFFYTRRVLYLGAVGGIVALALGVVLVDHLVVTDREQVALHARDLGAAANRRDVEQFGQLISEHFYTDGVTRETLLQRARRVFPELRRVTLKVHEVKAETGGKRLVCFCTATASGTVSGYDLEVQPYQLKLTYVKDADGQWRVREAEVWDVTGRQRFYPSGRWQ